MKPLRFKSRRITTKINVRPDDLQRARESNNKYVRYCKANGDYHADDPDGVCRLIRVEDLINEN